MTNQNINTPAPPFAAQSDGELQSLRECAAAWDAVVELLNELSPDWTNAEGAGMQCALAAIAALRQQVPSVGDVVTLGVGEVVTLEGVEPGEGFLASCTGCHESCEGVPTGQYSKVFRCHLGLGCHECGGLGAVWDGNDYSTLTAADAHSSPKAEPANRTAMPEGGLLKFAVDGWHSEVANRPIQNVHRRALDSVWRQVIKFAGGDDRMLCGPTHQELREGMTNTEYGETDDNAPFAYDPAKAVGLREVTEKDAYITVLEYDRQKRKHMPTESMLAALRLVLPLGIPVVPDGGKEATS